MSTAPEIVLTADSYAKAALFASGRTLTPQELADLSALSQERARALADDLAADYAAQVHRIF